MCEVACAIVSRVCFGWSPVEQVAASLTCSPVCSRQIPPCLCGLRNDCRGTAMHKSAAFAASRVLAGLTQSLQCRLEKAMLTHVRCCTQCVVEHRRGTPSDRPPLAPPPQRTCPCLRALPLQQLPVGPRRPGGRQSIISTHPRLSLHAQGWSFCVRRMSKNRTAHATMRVLALPAPCLPATPGEASCGSHHVGQMR